MKKLKAMRLLIFLLIIVTFGLVIVNDELLEENELKNSMKTFGKPSQKSFTNFTLVLDPLHVKKTTSFLEISRKKRFLSFNLYRCRR